LSKPIISESDDENADRVRPVFLDSLIHFFKTLSFQVSKLSPALMKMRRAPIFLNSLEK